jgi:hypothetical protein
MVSSPFEYSDPLEPGELVDRVEELEQVGDNLVATGNMRLVAPRRYGKTSLLRAALARAQDDGLVTVRVSFLGVLTLDDVAERIERAYSEQLDSGLRRWFTGLVRTLRPTLRAGGGPVPAAAEISPQPPAGALLDRLALPRRLHDKHGLMCAIAFDEFQDVLRAGREADAVIRSEIENHRGIAGYVFAGSHPGMMRELFASRRRAFFAQAKPVELSPLPPDDLADYCADRFASQGRDIGEALGSLLDTAQGHPQRAMLLAHHLFTHTPHKSTADSETWASALTEACREVDPEIQTSWAALSTTAQRMLAVIADGTIPLNGRQAEERYGLRKSGANRKTLQQLADDAHIAPHAGAATRWRVVDPLLALWLRNGRSWPGEP